jgi:hypothetical protein
LVEVRLGVLHRLEHEFGVDCRHAPDDGFNGAAVQNALCQLGRGEGWRDSGTGFRFLLLADGWNRQPAKQCAGGNQRRRG